MAGTDESMRGRLDRAFGGVLWLGLAAALLLVVLPLTAMIWGQVTGDWPRLLATAVEDAVVSSILLTVYCAAVATVIAMAFGLPAAYLLARHEFTGKELVESVLDVPVVIPHTVAGIALLTVLGRHGLIGAPLADVITFVDALPGAVAAMLFVSFPFFVNAAREGIAAVDPRLENVARTLGATRLEAVALVTLPLAARSVLSGAVMTWARAVSEFGAVVIIAYYPMIAPTLIYERYIGHGLAASRPVAVTLIMTCLAVFLAMRVLSRRLFTYDRAP